MLHLHFDYLERTPEGYLLTDEHNEMLAAIKVKGNIRVDVAPLRASAGDPTASWVQQELPDQLAKAMAGRMTSKGGTLVVRIDYLTLGPTKHSWSWDNISGVAMIGGAQRPVRATTRYQVSPIDQTMIEQSNHYRVTQLVQALTFWLVRDL